MIVKETAAGTPIVEFTAEEYADYLEGEVQRATGMTGAEFTHAYKAGALDDADPAVSEIVVLLRLGQNGVRAT